MVIFPEYLGPGAGNKLIHIDENDKRYMELRDNISQADVNIYLSDIIGIKRLLSDLRPDECKKIRYPGNLPGISIVITLRDEPISCLLRTIYSLLETSPINLINEIILVDDGSVNLELKLAVNVHVANIQKLKLISNEQPLGLTMARTRGIMMVASEFFIVLDGHIEVNPGWLEPIIYRLVQEPNALLTSNVGHISSENFEYILDANYQRLCAFDQITLGENWLTYSNSYRKARNSSVAPFEYGIIPGMMTAMRKEYFIELGGFDTGMEVWGYEHMELSVKVWLCGGRVEMIPCSIIAHLYRNAPWQKLHPKLNYIKKNKLRFILVWMEGEIQKLALEALQRGNNTKETYPGDLLERYRIKEENHCKPYQHYIDQIRRISNIFIPENILRKGNILNTDLNLCLDMANIDDNYELITYSCSSEINQFFLLTDNMNIRIDRQWLKGNTYNNRLSFTSQEQTLSNQELKWSFDDNSGLIKQGVRCLTANKSGKVSLELCNENPFQKWEWPPKYLR
ncbi:polypeptide N-acetylgalactosaminyltransferase 5-like [Ruditapes philippinarum]|uniref:polypeptide N-acetylgalactosaminyltransferase 5-like n=1 Tax=Ruditapes philippinarum TaxID=129788 RepID=UPI00295B6327|nr:polypeptide N-acetylgalactosaminyltransferase 5-like [Ruditapes philippinarum]